MGRGGAVKFYTVYSAFYEFKSRGVPIDGKFHAVNFARRFARQIPSAT